MSTVKRRSLLLIVAASVISAACGGCSAQSRFVSCMGEQTGMLISVEQQELVVVKAGQIIRQYPCSTAQAGIGNLQDSAKTPLGWHRVVEKIGDGLPAGAVFKNRQWTGRIWRPGEQTDEDLILSRILWLEGLEDGKNRGGDVDTYSRYIYIHGTNRMDELGRPASGGCIRMNPPDMIGLYEAVEEGCLVLIVED